MGTQVIQRHYIQARNARAPRV